MFSKKLFFHRSAYFINLCHPTTSRLRKQINKPNRRFNQYPADHDYCRFKHFYLLIKSLILGTQRLFKHQDLQRIDLKLNKYE